MKSNIFSKGIVIVLLVFLVIRLLYIDFVPIWDGVSITNCVLHALKPQLNFSELNCYHPSSGYLFLLALSQIIDWGNPRLLSIASLSLGLLGIFAFHKIVVFLFFNKENKMKRNYLLPNVEAMLMTWLFAFNPLFFANSLTPSLDFGVIVFFLVSLYSLMYSYTAQTVLAMTLMLLSKEPGMLLYGTLLIGILSNEILTRQTKNKKMDHIIKENYFYLIPLFVFLLHNWYLKSVTTQSVFWTSNLYYFFSINRLSYLWFSRSITRLLQVFVLNFNWIYTSIIIIFSSSLLRFITFKTQIRNLKAWVRINNFRLLIFLAFIFYAIPIISINTYTLPRYILPLIPLLILIALGCLRNLLAAPKKRLFILTVLAILTFIQTFKSIDPISTLAFGTFDFGKHKMYKMISHVKECCGIAGKDQLAYNAEFTSIHYLINKLYKEIQITPAVPLLIGNLDAAELFLPADANNLQRTLKAEAIIVPTVYLTTDLEFFASNRLPFQAYFVYLPWSDKEQEELTRVKKFYVIGNRKVIDYRGYQIYYYPLTRKITYGL